MVNRLGQATRVSRRQADEEIWELLLSQLQGKWVLVRDLDNKLAYYCKVTGYSDSGRDRELLMEDVDVLDSDTAEYRYTAPVLYICRDKDKLSIEKLLATPNHRAAGLATGGG